MGLHEKNATYTFFIHKFPKKKQNRDGHRQKKLSKLNETISIIIESSWFHSSVKLSNQMEC